MATTNVAAEPGIPQITVTREFNAPRDLVFRAFTDPGLLVQWLGPRRLTMTIDHFDVRHGGTWRYIHHDPNGSEYGFRGTFHGTPSVEDGVVQTFEFEGAPGHVQLDTAKFEDRGGKTLLRLTSSFQSVEDRDAMIESGMEQGLTEGLDQLDELIARTPVH